MHAEALLAFLLELMVSFDEIKGDCVHCTLLLNQVKDYCSYMPAIHMILHTYQTYDK